VRAWHSDEKNRRTDHVRNRTMGLWRLWTVSHGRLDHSRHCFRGRGCLTPTIRSLVMRAHFPTERAAAMRKVAGARRHPPISGSARRTSPQPAALFTGHPQRRYSSQLLINSRRLILLSTSVCPPPSGSPDFNIKRDIPHGKGPCVRPSRASFSSPLLPEAFVAQMLNILRQRNSHSIRFSRRMFRSLPTSSSSSRRRS